MEGGGEAIGLDIGGTKINAFRVARDGSILARSNAPTPAEDQEATLAMMIELAQRVLTPDVVAVGVGAAGLVESGEGMLRFAPNLAWRNLPIAARMREALGLPVLVENDASMAAFAEYRFGAGRGYRHLLLVAVGTGIGGGIVADGRLFRGAHGFASEIGHIIVEPGGPLCGCGNRGCWEQVAAGRAIGRMGRGGGEGARLLAPRPRGWRPGQGHRAARHGGGAARRRTREGDHHRSRPAARRGDRGARERARPPDRRCRRRSDRGRGPPPGSGEGLVPGGRRGPDYRPTVPIVPAELGNDAGAVGAGSLALEELRG